MCSKYHYLFKYVITGLPKVGKTTFITQFAEQSTRNTYVPTQTVQFASRAVQVNELTIKCQVWDVVMNGDHNERGESMKGLGDSLCKKAAAVMLLFDVTDRSSFERLERGIRELKTVIGEGTVIAVIGNKIDLEEQRVISTEECQGFAKYHEVIYFETSSYQHQNVQQIFTLISKMVIDKLANQEVKLEASGIKRGKKEIESPQTITPQAINTSWMSVESQWKNIEVSDDSDRMCGAIEEMMQMMKKAKLMESILSSVKTNIKEKGISYLAEIKNQYSSNILSKDSTIIQDMFDVFDLIQQEFSGYQLHLDRISSENEEMAKLQEGQADIKQLQQKCDKLEKKIEQLQVQKGKADQFKENADKRQRDLLVMIDCFKKEKKDTIQKCERQRKELNELENKNMELARELNNLREFESEIKLKQMVQERQNSEIIEELDSLQERGVAGELIDKLKKKFSLNNSAIRQDSRISTSSRS